MVDETDAQDQLLTSGPFVELAPSPNGKFLAAFSTAGSLLVLTADFARTLSEFVTKTTGPPRALVWCAAAATGSATTPAPPPPRLALAPCSRAQVRHGLPGASLGGHAADGGPLRRLGQVLVRCCHPSTTMSSAICISRVSPTPPPAAPPPPPPPPDMTARSCCCPRWTASGSPLPCAAPSARSPLRLQPRTARLQ